MSCDYTPAPDCLPPLPSEPALIINLHSFAWYKSDVSCMGEYSCSESTGSPCTDHLCYQLEMQ